MERRAEKVEAHLLRVTLDVELDGLGAVRDSAKWTAIQGIGLQSDGQGKNLLFQSLDELPVHKILVSPRIHQHGMGKSL